MKQRSLKLNAILNGIKQCCTIIFPLITFPYVSRVLGNAGYGKYSFSQSVTSYFILIAALGINTYAIREGAKIRDDEEKITEFCSQVFSINVCSSIIAFLALIVTMMISTKVHEYMPYILIESLAIWMSLIGTNWVNSIYEDYLYLTIRYIVVQTLALICMFLFVKSPADVIPYCIISVLASRGGELINILYVKKYVRIIFTFHMDFQRHIVPLLILFINTIAITIYVSSDITMLGFYADDATVGVYSFASKIYNILKQLINAVVVVSLPRISYVIKNRTDEYNNYLNKIFCAVNILLFPVIIGTFCMSDTIILVAGGSQYISGTNALKILSIATLFAIYASIFTNCVLIVNRQEDKCLKSTLVSACINIVLNFILLPKIGMVGAAITTVIAETVNCSMQIHYSKLYFDWHKLEWKRNVSCFYGAIIIACICVACNLFINRIMIRMLVAIVASAIAYFSILLILKNEVAYSTFQSFMKKLIK